MPMGVLEHELFYNPFFLHSFKTETLQLFIIKFLIGCPKGENVFLKSLMLLLRGTQYIIKQLITLQKDKSVFEQLN